MVNFIGSWLNPKPSTRGRHCLTLLSDQVNTRRRLACAILLRACLDAAAGNFEAMAWIYSAPAELLATRAGLEHWPPKFSQLATKGELIQRARGAGFAM